jgi:hypothetical protein
MDSGRLAARILVPAFALAVVCLAIPAFAQESPSFKMERVAATASAGYAESPRFSTRVVVSQESPSGGMASVCGNGWIHTAGFFSLLASGPVPIWLTVERPQIDPLEIELSWTGSDDAFEVRRTFDAQTINDPGSLLQVVSACDTSDPSPTENDLIFYLVVAEPPPP